MGNDNEKPAAQVRPPSHCFERGRGHCTSCTPPVCCECGRHTKPCVWCGQLVAAHTYGTELCPGTSSSYFTPKEEPPPGFEDLVNLHKNLAELSVSACRIVDASGLTRREIEDRMGEPSAGSVQRLLDGIAEVLAKFAWACGYDVDVQFSRFQDTSQPKPTPNDTPALWPELLALPEGVDWSPELRQIAADRHAIGIQRYGTPLQRGNGRNFHQDALEEALDLTIYLYGAESDLWREAARLAAAVHSLNKGSS